MQFIHDLLQFRLEFRRIQLLGASGPPCMPELLPPVTKVHSDMTDAAKPLVLLRLHGIEKARFIERSGPDLITGGDWHFMLAAKIYKGDFLIKKIGLSLNIKVILTIGEDDWFRRKDGTSIVDDNPRLQRTDQIGVIVTATQIVDIPAIWHGRSIHP